MTQEKTVKLFKIESVEAMPAPPGNRFLVKLWVDESRNYTGDGPSLLYAFDSAIRQMLLNLEMGNFNGTSSISGWQFLQTSSTNKRYRIWMQMKPSGSPNTFEGMGETELSAVFMALSNSYRSLFGINLMAKA